MGWDLSKHRNIARGDSLICIYKDPTCNGYKSLILLLGGKLVLVQGRYKQKVGGFGKKWGLFG